jgi:hypothetical protein
MASDLWPETRGTYDGPKPDVSMYAPIEYVLWSYVMVLKMLKMDAGVMKNTETHSGDPECDSDVWSELCLGHTIHNYTRIAPTCINVALLNCTPRNEDEMTRARSPDLI